MPDETAYPKIYMDKEIYERLVDSMPSYAAGYDVYDVYEAGAGSVGLLKPAYPLETPYGRPEGVHQPVAPTGGRQPIVPTKGTYVPEKNAVAPDKPAETWRDRAIRDPIF